MVYTLRRNPANKVIPSFRQERHSRQPECYVSARIPLGAVLFSAVLITGVNFETHGYAALNRSPWRLFITAGNGIHAA